jgi:predicted secreted acid phosphatase
MRDRSPRLIAAALAAPLAAAFAAAAPATEPSQPATAREIIEYHDSGEWDADIAAVIDAATEHLRADLSDNPVSRPAIVLDIDDTSLSSYECLRSFGFDRKRAGETCARSSQLPAIAPTRELFRLARAEGVSVFFITGRRERQRAATTANLRSAGYRGVWTLRLRPTTQPRSQRAGWKARVRRGLVRRGYRIVANVGDQRSDLSGGSAVRTFKLPNPMYTIPIA